MGTSKWTRQVPAKAGYYWARFIPDGQKVIVQIDCTAVGPVIYLFGSSEEQDPTAFAFLPERLVPPAR